MLHTLVSVMDCGGLAAPAIIDYGDLPILPDEYPSDEHTVSDYSDDGDTDYSDSDDDGTKIDVDFEGRTWSVRKKTMQTKGGPAANGGLPNYRTGDYDTLYWNCSTVGKGSDFVRMTDLYHGGVYVVPMARVNKALRHLCMNAVTGVLTASKGACRCKRNPPCYQAGLTTYAIMNIRRAFFQQMNEVGATKFLADLVRSHQPNGKTQDAKFKWMINELEVCDDFFSTVFGISRDKLKSVRMLLRGDKGALSAPPTRPERPRVKYVQCTTFWSSFFMNCQRPNNTTRLFPVNASYPTIYEDYFIPWMEKIYRTRDELPCLGYFMLARHDSQFSDVKDRAKHYHARCQDCANLQSRRLEAFNSAYEQEQYQAEWQDHQTEKRGWREFEAAQVLDGKHNPQVHNVFWFDDTESLGLPKFTKRTMKNIPTSRFHMIPFLIADLARGRDYYMYTSKNRFKKGANRLCTSLMAAIRATKESTHESRHARKLTLIADNASENKNNTLLAFLSDLVMRGWYDEIQLIYGPPGHTHNGGDQQHQIHNEILGNFTSPTFVHLLARYPQSWRQEHTRPTPCVLDVQYDWDNYYKPFINKIAGHTNCPTDPVAARGFRIARGDDGIVGLSWKTKAESGRWCGADGKPDTPGFVMLKGRPRGMPVEIDPQKHVLEKKYYRQLIGEKMTTCLLAEGAPEARAWLKSAAKHGVIPVHRRIEARGEITPGEMGSRVELKCDDITAVVQLIQHYDQTADQFWTLPAEIARVLSEGNQAAEARSAKHRLHPAIGYASIPMHRRPTWDGSAAEAIQGRKENDLESSAEELSDDSEEEEDEIIVNNRSRLVAAQAGREVNKRQREGPAVQPVIIKEETHNVKAVFGLGDKGAEVWFGVVAKGRNKGGKVRLQFMQEVEGQPGMYLLLKGSELYDAKQIEHTLPNVVFVQTTVHKVARNGRLAAGKETKTMTKAPLDVSMVADLYRRCQLEASEGEAAAVEDEDAE